VHTAERDSEAIPAAASGGELDEAILREGRQLLDRACTGDQRDRGQAAVMTDDLLDRAKHSLYDGTLSAPCYARVMRASALVRNMARLPELPPDPLVHDLIAHTVKHGLAAHNAAAQALRGTLAASRGSVDEALDAAVDAMATIELSCEHSVERALALNDIAALLDQLALIELSSNLYGQSAAEFGAVGMRGYQIMMTGDQVRTEVLHGLWLERIGQRAAGAVQFANAAERATAALKLWRESDPPPDVDDEFAGDFEAALALADPDRSREPVLRKITSRIALPGHIVAGLALARLLAADGRRDEAEVVLASLRVECRRLQLGLPLRLALARGLLDLPRTADDTTGVAGYVMELEDHIWHMREARARALYARLEHERLRRDRRPMRSLTDTDPVTRLPDRGVLDGLLAELHRHELPIALAMVDVDDLVQVNERGSYADGDAVLRAVAVTVRGAVRPQDSVIRYSGDEFVVLMPGRTLEDAADTMRNVVSSVTKLPYDRGRGVTVSVGVVAVEPGEGGESALVRADDAMAEAKAQGGNQVAAVPMTPAPR
jgi:diguanylate cyclase